LTVCATFHHLTNEQRLRGAPGERRLAREHLEQDAPQCIDVAARVDLLLAPRLLGAHVGGRANSETGRRQLFSACRRDGSCHAEVDDHRVTFRQQDVVGLDIAMDDAAAVSVLQAVRHLACDREGLLHRQLFLAGQPLTQRLSLHVRHDIIEKAIGLSGVVDGEDVRMHERRGDLDFSVEAIGADGRRQLRPQHLDGDLPVVPQIVAQKHLGEPATADLALDRIAAVKRGLEAVTELVHAASAVGEPSYVTKGN
jgi:hypothetical protein